MGEALEAIEYSNNSGKYWLTKTKIDVYDMYSEGPCAGLVTGVWSFSGNYGEIGWRTGTFTPYVGTSNDIRKCRSIFWNEVPVTNDAGQFNFQSIDFTDTIGLPNGAIINNDYGGRTTVVRSIGERLRQTQRDQNQNIIIDERKRYRILNVDCAQAYINIRIVQLSVVEDDTTGDLAQNEMSLSFYYRPLFQEGTPNPLKEFKFHSSVKMRGKITQAYIHSELIKFDNNYQLTVGAEHFIGWEVMVERSTKEVYDSNFRAVIFVDSLVEVYGKVLTHPNCAIVRQKFDAEYFQQIPNRSFDVQLLKVKIPSSYDPIVKTYSEPRGAWDGTFKTGFHWTDNPAWCYYDLITNPRYGLGKYIPNVNVDKFKIYEIGKYCDTLVHDGFGGLEPRFTCNLYLTSREEAFKVLNDMASIFHGIAYYGNGTINIIQDSPRIPIVQFTNDNVENGEFSYSSSAKKARHTVCMVRYNDPMNFYRPAVEYVEDIDAIRRYGIKELDLTAFGCTSRGQAVRLGRWALLSETLLTETVSFTAGLEGAYLRPGDVFSVFDKYRKSVKNAGRILNHEINSSGSLLWLDSNTTLSPNTSYKFSLLTPGFDYNHPSISGLTSEHYSGSRNTFIQRKEFIGSSAVTGISGTRIQFNTQFDNTNYIVDRYQVYSIELASGDYYLEDHKELVNPTYDYYRVINIDERDDYRYHVMALQYSEQKFLEIESGLSFERPLEVLRARPASPAGMNVSVETDRSSQIINYNLIITDYSGVTSYKVYGKKDDFVNGSVPSNDYLISDLPITRTFDTHLPSGTGTYYFRAYGYNSDSDLYSNNFASGQAVIINSVNPILNVIVSSLEIIGFTGALEMPNFTPLARTTNLNPIFRWQVGGENDHTAHNDFGYRVTIRQPSETSIPSNTIYYEVTGDALVNANMQFEFPFSLNNSAELQAVGGPFRNYDIIVEAIISGGFTSAGNSLNPLNEGGWAYHPNGWDILGVRNEPISGINLSSGNVHPVGYETKQYIDINSDGYVIITGGIVPQDCVGGFMYISRTPFSVSDAQTGKYNVYRTEFSWDHISEHAYAPRAGNFLRLKSGYMAVSFYDEFDYAKWHPNLFTGLYVSNTTPVIITGDLGITSVYYNDGTTAKLETRMVNGNERTVLIYNNGSEIVI
jgi:hypothetical protein